MNTPYYVYPLVCLCRLVHFSESEILQDLQGSLAEFFLFAEIPRYYEPRYYEYPLVCLCISENKKQRNKGGYAYPLVCLCGLTRAFQ